MRSFGPCRSAISGERLADLILHLADDLHALGVILRECRARD